MLAKLTNRNQLTLPKAVTQAVGPAEYFQVEALAGQIVLTPVRIRLRGRSSRLPNCCSRCLHELNLRDPARQSAADLAVSAGHSETHAQGRLA